MGDFAKKISVVMSGPFGFYSTPGLSFAYHMARVLPLEGDYNKARLNTHKWNTKKWNNEKN